MVSYSLPLHLQVEYAECILKLLDTKLLPRYSTIRTPPATYFFPFFPGHRVGVIITLIGSIDYGQILIIVN